MICIECKRGRLQSRKAGVPAEVKGDKMLVNMEALVCPRCGYTTIDGKQMAEYMRLSADAYRHNHSLLTSSEIRSRRRALRMSQEQFAAYLGTGVASVKRWELGQIQDQAMDRLMRLMTDVEWAKNNYLNVAALIAPAEANP
jgi:putative zinc finger/helix-turn-helix YgiT family protein